MSTDPQRDYRPDSYTNVVDLPADPGIRDAIRILRDGGLDVVDSVLPDSEGTVSPTIRFRGNAWAGYKAFAVAMEGGLVVRRIQRVWGAADGQIEGPWWEIAFHVGE
jgi:hypothetical protein